MFVMRRTFHLQQDDYPDAGDPFVVLRDELHNAITNHVQPVDFRLDGWPNGQWAGPQQTVESSEWLDGAERLKRLLQLRFEEREPDHCWRLNLHIGSQDGGSVVLSEEWQAETPSRSLPYADLPPVLEFLRGYPLRNTDGLPATAVLTLRPQRLAAFVDFIRSPTRRLPVALFSPRPPGSQQADARQLVDLTRGLAHVISLENKTAEDLLSDMLPSHRCFNGAVRLFMPRFHPDDKAWLHPYWLPQKANPDDVVQEIMDQVARESILLDRSPIIEDLRRRRDDYYRAESQRSRRERLEEASRRLKAEKDAELYVEMAEALEAEVGALTATKERLTEANASLRDEVRQLRWRINQQWQYKQPPDQKESLTPQVYLSARARARYDSLAADERTYWDAHILPKLLDEQLRDSQTEAVASINGTCLVYPRKRSADGRRVIYYCEGADVYVCELFTTREHDREYDELRDRGVDRLAYDQFRKWE